MGAAPPCSGGLDGLPHASEQRDPAPRRPFLMERPVSSCRAGHAQEPNPPSVLPPSPTTLLWCAVTRGCRSSEEEVRAAAPNCAHAVLHLYALVQPRGAAARGNRAWMLGRRPGGAANPRGQPVASRRMGVQTLCGVAGIRAWRHLRSQWRPPGGRPRLRAAVRHRCRTRCLPSCAQPFPTLPRLLPAARTPPWHHAVLSAVPAGRPVRPDEGQHGRPLPGRSPPVHPCRQVSLPIRSLRCSPGQGHAELGGPR